MLTQKNFYVGTSREIDILNIGHDVRSLIRESGMENGWVTVLCRQSGAFLVPLESQTAAVKENREELRKKMSDTGGDLWNRFLPRMLTIPVEKGKMMFEPWQELYLVDFETRGTRREIVVQLGSESPPEQGPVRR